MKKKILMGVLLTLPVLAVIWLPGCGQRNAQENTPANQMTPGETASNAPAIPPPAPPPTPPTPPAPAMPDTNSPGTNAPAAPPAANQ